MGKLSASPANVFRPSLAGGFSDVKLTGEGELLWSQLTKFGRSPGVHVLSDGVSVSGCQEFYLFGHRREPVPLSKDLRRSQILAGRFINGDFLSTRTVLDLNACAGFYSVWACRKGAPSVVSLDLEDSYLGILAEIQRSAEMKGIRSVKAKVQDWREPADLVLAFGLVHWLYSCREDFESLDAVVNKLAALTRSVLLIEWIGGDDEAIQSCKSNAWAPKDGEVNYNQAAFEASLAKHFLRVELLGKTSATRSLYAARHGVNLVNINATLPLLAPAESVISSHWLCAENGKQIFSRVYFDRGRDCIIKQTSGDMAVHEASLLARAKGIHFPRVLSSEQRDGYSVVYLELIEGKELIEARPEISASPKRLGQFFDECLGILGQLQHVRIRHRDIRGVNMRIRDGHPVLLDFGLAELEEQPRPAHFGLGGTERITKGPPCDTYSMGKVFEQLIPRGSKIFAPLLEKMLTPKLARRLPVNDLVRTLRELNLPEKWDASLVFPIPRHPEPWRLDASHKLRVARIKLRQLWGRRTRSDKNRGIP